MGDRLKSNNGGRIGRLSKTGRILLQIERPGQNTADQGSMDSAIVEKAHALTKSEVGKHQAANESVFDFSLWTFRSRGSAPS